MIDWFASLAPRERKSVMGAAALVVVVMLYVAVIEPVLEHRAMLERGIAAQRDLVTWMRDVAGELDSDTPAAEAGGSLFAVVDRSVRGTALAGAVQRVQPEGAGTVRVWLDGADFDELVRWIAVLDRRHGIGVSSLAAERGPAPGSVNVRLTLERDG